MDCREVILILSVYFQTTPAIQDIEETRQSKITDYMRGTNAARHIHAGAEQKHLEGEQHVFIIFAEFKQALLQFYRIPLDVMPLVRGKTQKWILIQKFPKSSRSVPIDIQRTLRKRVLT
jgi:hypothetical protein